MGKAVYSASSVRHDLGIIKDITCTDFAAKEIMLDLVQFDYDVSRHFLWITTHEFMKATE